MLIDTHAHLDDERFRGDLAAVLERARQANVGHIVAVATTESSSRACLELARCYADLRATIGIHPNHVAQSKPGDWDLVARLADDRRVVAIGETGLDRHWNDTPFPQQEDFFGRHLELGRRIDKAVVIHCREAEADMMRLLCDQFERHGPIRAVLHSFTGSLASARACLEMGLYISFAGMLTYKNAQDLREVAAHVPLDRVLVETDCPYLSPMPVRGRRNEPAHVVHTATCLANVLGVSLETLSEQTTVNALRLFSMDQ